MTGRIIVAGRQLAVVIRCWLRSTPDRLWGTDHNYEKLKAMKMADPDHTPDPRREVADYLAARIEEVGWEVSHCEPEHPGSPPPCSGES